MTNELQQNRYDRLIRRVGGIIGTGSKVSEVLTELFPMIDVELVPGELLRLMETRICMGGGTLAAVANEAGRMQVFNPTDSGKLVTITKVYFAMGTAGTVRWGVVRVSLNGRISTEVFRDTRDPVTQMPTGQIHQLSSVALAPATMTTRVQGNTPLILEDENSIAVLAPGTGFEIGTGLNNTATHYGFLWRERVAEQSELIL